MWEWWTATRQEVKYLLFCPLGVSFNFRGKERRKFLWLNSARLLFNHHAFYDLRRLHPSFCTWNVSTNVCVYRYTHRLHRRFIWALISQWGFEITWQQSFRKRDSHSASVKLFLILRTVLRPQFNAKWNMVPLKKSRLSNLSQSLSAVIASFHWRWKCVVCLFLADSENSYTLSCGVPVQPGKVPQKRNATTALPTCAGTVCWAWWEKSYSGWNVAIVNVGVAQARDHGPVSANKGWIYEIMWLLLGQDTAKFG